MKTRQARAPARKSKVTRQRQERPGRTTIDTSDIAPLTDEFFAKAVRNPYYRPVKQSTTVRIDADGLA